MRSKNLKLVTYFGAKSHMRPLLLSLLPSHKTYVEVFGGSAILLLNKTPSPVEVYNDFSGDLVNLFEVVRTKPEEFIKSSRGLIYSRQLYEEWKKWIKTGSTTSTVERAVRFAYVILNSFSSDAAGGWSFSKTGGGLLKPEAMNNSLSRENVMRVHARIRNVYIEHSDFTDLIPRWDSPTTLFFLDPPYLKGGEVYKTTMTLDEHEVLVELLKSIKGKWILTYNDCSEVRSWYKGYPMIEYSNVNLAVKTKVGEKKPKTKQLVILSDNLVTLDGLIGKI